jgi:hypothetical protein
VAAIVFFVGFWFILELMEVVLCYWLTRNHLGVHDFYSKMSLALPAIVWTFVIFISHRELSQKLATRACSGFISLRNNDSPTNR